MRCSSVVVCLAAFAASGVVAADDELCFTTKQCVLLNGTKCDRSINPANCPYCLKFNGGDMPLCTNPTFDGCAKGVLCESAKSTRVPTTTSTKPTTTSATSKPSPTSTTNEPVTGDPTEAPTDAPTVAPTTTTASTTTSAPTTTVASPASSMAISALCSVLVVAVSCLL
ncbi:hypothetical protein H310_09746 [Aphanomyces invadans]|uniref:Uncharacterized protein n=1 Tax=Aphanomyces invadans TaxID=157072 RepID=A0A024TVT0_9STRA|nr:hypothetical protein H310_09746 [Aphanomyces invadans]ETV97417.1 hypothetical protein H310_09746 [Aphanomyces invadans]|eukprot:XP_008874125.1 hypothetical protein H310_09746 [Aphanomyces invadans]